MFYSNRDTTLDQIDFLHVSTILKYLAYFVVILLAGVVSGNIVGTIMTSFVMFFILTKNLHKSIEYLFIWFFLYNFLIGQGYLTNQVVIKYLSKPSFLIFLIFIFFIQHYRISLLKSKFLFVWLLFIIISGIGTVIQGQTPFAILTWSNFFMIYIILQSKKITTKQLHQLLNLFVAAAILQTFVSVLQVTRLIPPPTKMMDDGSGGQFLWVPGLDDVASGTFGPAVGYLTSWYAALMSVLLLLTWSLTKKNIYIIVTILIFLQFATTDSKTVMGVTLLMIVYMMYIIAKKRNLFRLNVMRYARIAVIIILGAYGFYKAWDIYYHYYAESKKSNLRAGVSAVYTNMVEKTKSTVLSNWQDWGKIRGYQYIYNDYLKNDYKQVIWGYGLSGYSYNDKMAYIESLDTPIMKYNNFTRSRSGLISTFAKTGVVGFFLFCSAIFYWYKYNKKKMSQTNDVLVSNLLKIWMIFTSAVAFVYGMSISSIPLIALAAIVSIYTNLTKQYLSEFSILPDQNSDITMVNSENTNSNSFKNQTY